MKDTAEVEPSSRATTLKKLSKSEQQKLTTLEKTIEVAMQSYTDIGTALLAIREGKLYRATHRAFEDYCRDKWKMSKTHANRLIDAAKTAVGLAPFGVIPCTEGSVRPLVPLKSAQRKKVWAKVLEVEKNPLKITGALVNKVRQEVVPRKGVKLSGDRNRKVKVYWLVSDIRNWYDTNDFKGMTTQAFFRSLIKHLQNTYDVVAPPRGAGIPYDPAS